MVEGCKGTPKDALLENEVLPTVEENTNNSAPVTVSGAEGGVAVENPVEASVAPVEAPVVDVASATSDSAPKSTGPEPKERTGILITDLPGVAARVLPLLVMTVIGYVWPNFGNVVDYGCISYFSCQFYLPNLVTFKGIWQTASWFSSLGCSIGRLRYFCCSAWYLYVLFLDALFLNKHNTMETRSHRIPYGIVFVHSVRMH